MKELNKLLSKIKAGEAINYGRMLKLMPSTVNTRELFTPSMLAKDKYLVEINNHALFDELLLRVTLPESRAEAANHVYLSSHSHHCESAYLLCFPASDVLSNRPEKRQLHVSAVNQGERLNRTYTAAKQALLIENQDCFFQWQHFVDCFESQLELDQLDIYFAGGDRILNSDLAPVLAEYDALFCAFDYDLKGLQIAQSLQVKKLAQTHILLPDKLNEMDTLFTFTPSSTSHLQKALSVCEQLDLLELKKVLYRTRHFMEQEALLSVKIKK